MDDHWQKSAKGLLRGELRRRNLSNKDLCVKLAALGIDDNERNITNKISRGRFTAAFLLQCLAAIECRTLHLDDA